MLSKIKTKILKWALTESEQFLPTKGSLSAAGYDLRAAIDEPLHILPGETHLIPCGIAMEIPENHVGLVCPRSGLAVKYGITVLNSPGVIDSDYRGQMHVLLHRVGIFQNVEQTYTILPGERIGQLLIIKIENLWSSERVDELSNTNRGTSGFGSTGKT